ncbi:MAG: helix-turn-helix domain-containing protein [Planctomycetaceae bacterium]|nr:helix-turn-helix domain-containing protein [Planctomycetaceae bacterium]
MSEPVSQTARTAEFLHDIDDSLGFIELFCQLNNVHFYVKNRQGQFMAVNRASMLRNGVLHESEILGRTDYDFHPPEMAAAYRAEDQQVMDSNRPLPDQVWLVYDHLQVQQWFSCTKVPLHDRAGRVIGVAGAMTVLDTIDKQSPYAPFGEAINHVLKHHDQQIRVSRLAELSGCSVSQFDRRFRKVFSMTPTQYILRVRVNAARNLLSRSSRSIADIALASGFYDQSQLARYFKRLTGMTPSQYRRQFHSVS